jgi:hypothetical protein
MAFDGKYLHLMVPSPPGVPQQWSYKTPDSAATVDTANYFSDGLEMGMRVYDLVLRTTVTNIGASNEAFSSQGFHVINAASRSAGTIDAADAVALSGTDTD